jgi:hypothetical protein
MTIEGNSIVSVVCCPLFVEKNPMIQCYSINVGW